MSKKEIAFWLLIVAIICATIGSCFYIVYSSKAPLESACQTIAKQLRDASNESL